VYDINFIKASLISLSVLNSSVNIGGILSATLSGDQIRPQKLYLLNAKLSFLLKAILQI